MSAFTPRLAILLVLLTVVWGFNWPVMKIGVTDVAPLTFRALSLWLGLPILALALVAMKVPLRVPRRQWREVFALACSNMFVWHVLAILGVAALSSGRAAILGYTMPIFSALIGWLWFRERLSRIQTAGVIAASVGVALLLWHEFARLAGAPIGALLMLVGAASWAYGVHRMRRTHITTHTLTIGFWLVVLTAMLLLVLAILFESARWAPPTPRAWGSILYNAVLIFGFAHSVWFTLARSLPPVASTLSVMMIPVLGVLSGAWWLGERLYWQDWAAMLLMTLAIASVLWPARRPAPAAAATATESP